MLSIGLALCICIIAGLDDTVATGGTAVIGMALA
jgi:hypothetical protein